MRRFLAIVALSVSAVLDVLTGWLVVVTAQALRRPVLSGTSGSVGLSLGFAAASFICAILITATAVALLQGRPYGGAWIGGLTITCVLLAGCGYEAIALGDS